MPLDDDGDLQNPPVDRRGMPWSVPLLIWGKRSRSGKKDKKEKRSRSRKAHREEPEPAPAPMPQAPARARSPDFGYRRWRFDSPPKEEEYARDAMLTGNPMGLGGV